METREYLEKVMQDYSQNRGLVAYELEVNIEFNTTIL